MDFLLALESSAFSTWIREGGSMFGYPGVLTLHTLGLAMLVGASFVVDLRLLGIAREMPIARLNIFYKAMWIGLIINTLSGLILFAADAVKKAGQPIFYIKLLLIGSALIAMARIKRKLPLEADNNSGLPSATRNLVVLSLVLWAGAITAGRLMAYLNNEPPRIAQTLEQIDE